MLLWLRKILFYLLLISYLIGTPYMMLFGLGYVFNPSEGELMKTGLISINTDPRTATVYVEGKKFSHKTPAVIRGLRPGQYQVRLTRKGFETWRKEVQILPEKATRLDPVILLPEHPEREEIIPEPVRAILPRFHEFKIFVSKDPFLAGLLKIDLLFNKEISLAAKNTRVDRMELLDIFSRQDSDFVVLKVREKGKLGFIFYDLDREKAVKDLTGWLPPTWDLLDWDSKNGSQIFFLKKGVLSGWDLEKDIPIPMAEDGILGFGVRNSRLYFMKQDYSLWQMEAKGAKTASSLETGEGFAGTFSKISADYFQIQFLKRDFFQKEVLLFLSNKGALLTSSPPYLLMDRGVLGLEQSERGELDKVLYWTKKEIGIFDFTPSAEGELPFPSKGVLHRLGDSIQKALWIYEGTHVLFQDESQVYLLEIGEQIPLVRPLESVAKNSQIIFQDRQKAIYYLRSQDRHLMKRKITE